MLALGVLRFDWSLRFGSECPSTPSVRARVSLLPRWAYSKTRKSAPAIYFCGVCGFSINRLQHLLCAGSSQLFLSPQQKEKELLVSSVHLKSVIDIDLCRVLGGGFCALEHNRCETIRDNIVLLWVDWFHVTLWVLSHHAFLSSQNECLSVNIVLANSKNFVFG